MKKTNLLFLFSLLISISLSAQIKDRKLDKVIQNSLETFEVPGISVGIIKDGKIVYAEGHGVRSLKNNKPMTKETLVGIASNSKGFTCFSLAMLVDEGKLDWDDKVRKYIPEFKMPDAFVTEEFTIRDLVTHRSGLGLGAGDLMFFPEGSDFTIEDVIANMSKQDQKSAYRSSFKYNNNMFIIAGEVLHRVSGLTWEEFIEQRILQPVGMKNSKASYSRVTDKSNIIDAHTRTEGEVIHIPHDWSDLANPAGGIMSNVSDMLTWAEFLMNDAVTKKGERLLSEEQMHNLWQLQTPLPVSKENDYNTHFSGYSLGWFVSDVNGGYKQVSHTGGLLGTVTQFTMIPELDLGIVVLTNQMVGSAFSSITNTIKDSYLGYKDRNWVEKYGEKNEEWITYNDSIKTVVYKQVEKIKNKPALETSKILGTYQDDWFGEITIKKEGNELQISSARSSQLTGKLLPYSLTTYIAKWDNRSFDADVFVLFTLNEKGEASEITMKPIAPITDFSFDFEDLHFYKNETED
ncbi:serine hydrolase [Mesonia aestuariivivens]|uniref:Serine hydrolase n=1 Tax=Mesonia aestuariivivens TaxID=2796128 RepID=A0ABS6W220_9FLAO|nr:serine hydrolase [Mesonia aestuariivivens]MBW2961900.1 serine hydrolase [Mesonia aestuariivivens]